MPVRSELLAQRHLETLETQRGISECGVTALKAANAVKVFRAEEGRDKELIDWRFSGGFSCEIREKASPAKVTATGSQLHCELIRRGQGSTLLPNIVIFINIWLACCV